MPLKHLAFGFLVLGLLGVAEYRGWSLMSTNEVKDAAPRSVRDNPGAYRPLYYGGGRYVGGK